jgi:hypothetical protein
MISSVIFEVFNAAITAIQSTAIQKRLIIIPPRADLVKSES